MVLVLVAIGAAQRRRFLPELQTAAETGQAPGGAGGSIRRALTAEAALFAGRLVATAILVGAASPSALSAGPQSASATLGEARVDLTVDPALAGDNEVHVYLLDADDGSQYDELRSVQLEATMFAEEIGPIDFPLRKAGPGHYTAPDRALGHSRRLDARGVLAGHRASKPPAPRWRSRSGDRRKR